MVQNKFTILVFLGLLQFVPMCAMTFQLESGVAGESVAQTMSVVVPVVSSTELNVGTSASTAVPQVLVHVQNPAENQGFTLYTPSAQAKKNLIKRILARAVSFMRSFYRSFRSFFSYLSSIAVPYSEENMGDMTGLGIEPGGPFKKDGNDNNLVNSVSSNSGLNVPVPVVLESLPNIVNVGVIRQEGSSCGYHALKNVCALLEDRMDDVVDQAVVDTLIGANGSWRQQILAKRAIDAWKDWAKGEAQKHFMRVAPSDSPGFLSRLFSWFSSPGEEATADGSTTRMIGPRTLEATITQAVYEKFKEAINRVVRTKCRAVVANESESILVTVDDIRNAIRGIAINDGITDHVQQAVMRLQNESTQGDYLNLSAGPINISNQALAEQDNRNEIGDNLRGDEIESLITDNNLNQGEHFGITVVEDYGITQGERDFIRHRFATNPQYRHGFVVNINDWHYFTVVVTNENVYVADSMGRDYRHDWRVIYLLAMLRKRALLEQYSAASIKQAGLSLSANFSLISRDEQQRVRYNAHRLLYKIFLRKQPIQA